MPRINPYDLDPEEARHAFADFMDEVFNKIRNEMWEIDHEISYILHMRYHPKNFDNIDFEVVSYLEKNGLKRTDKATTKSEKANSDYYLAAYFGLEITEYFRKNHQSMSFDHQINDLCYAKKQLAILETLSPIGTPKNQGRDTSGQSKGAKIRNTNKYQLTRQRAIIEWESYKKALPEWLEYKNDPSINENRINETLKDFEQEFCKSLIALKYSKAKSEVADLLDEKYTDSMANPPLAIGWILEYENLPNKQKEQANKKRRERKYKDSPFKTLDELIKIKNKQ